MKSASTLPLAIMGVSCIVAKATANLYRQLPSTIDEVDVIIAGGGTAGSIIASRLADSDRALSILVIEQGPDSYNRSEVIYPALFERNTLPGSDTALFWKARAAPQLAGREPVVETGGVLGGGSAINWMVYTRPQWDDLDAWNASGWSTGELLPYIRRFETYHGAGPGDTHGRHGPVHVSKGTYRAERAEEAFVAAAEAVGYPRVEDLQSLRDNDGAGPWYRYVAPDAPLRQDVAHQYLHPRLRSGGFPNLHVVVESRVERVVFDGKRAAGVEFGRNPAFAGEGGPQGKARFVAARKLVVVAAGALATPLLLERSGVGSPQVLEQIGVPVVESLPGVGNAMQDHHFAGYVYRTSLTLNETNSGIARGTRDVDAMIATQDVRLGWNGHDASSKLRPPPQDIAALGPEFQAAWDRDFASHPNKPLMIMGLFNAFFGDPDNLPDDAQYATIAPWPAYPYARGHIHSKGAGIDDGYDFDLRWLLDADDIDLKKHIWGYKIQREIARRMGIFRGELAAGHPRFAAGSAAAVMEVADGPVKEGTPRIQYTSADDEAIVQYVRENIGTSRHPLGTCKLAAREDGGVVDAALNVYGLSNIKVADLSVAPGHVAANTNSVALMLGEKAADIIKAGLGIGLQ